MWSDRFLFKQWRAERRSLVFLASLQHVKPRSKSPSSDFVCGPISFSLPLLQIHHESIMNLSNVTVAEPTQQVSGRYCQRILDNGHKFLLTPPPFYAEHGPFIRSWENGARSLSLPLSPELKSDLLKIQNFVSEKIVIPSDVHDSPHRKLKAVYLGDELFLTMSKWCSFFKLVNGRNAYECITENDFGKGEYFVTIEVSHVYIGPHQNGDNCSLSMCVLKIVYKEACIDNTFNELMSLFESDPPPAPQKAKRIRKKKSCIAGDVGV